jgi:phosphatidylglycerophosphate synthase
VEVLLKQQMGDHVRENGSVLARVEKQALVWMAERMPRAVNSDHLSGLGLGAMALAGASFALARIEPMALWGVVAGLIVNWFGDSLDGTLARVRKQQRPRYGYYVDHVIDILGASFLLGGLALSGFMTPIVALVLLILYLLVAAEVYLATHAGGVFRMAFLGFGPTELRIVLAVGTLFLFRSSVASPFGLGPFLLFDVGGVVAIAGMSIALVAGIVRNTRQLYLAEPIPGR